MPGRQRIEETVCDGKYTFISEPNDYRIFVLRYGEPWLAIEHGSRAVDALLFEFAQLRRIVDRAP